MFEMLDMRGLIEHCAATRSGPRIDLRESCVAPTSPDETE